MISYILIIYSILMTSRSSKIDKFCENPIVDAVFRPNDKCLDCIYLLSDDYIFIVQKSKNVIEREIQSLWKGIPIQIEAENSFWQIDHSNQVVFSGSTKDWTNWPSNFIDILFINLTNYYALYREKEDFALRLCVLSLTQKETIKQFDCHKDSQLIRVFWNDSNKIGLILPQNADEHTLPLSEIIEVTAVDSYEDYYTLYGMNDVMYEINKNHSIYNKKKITDFIKCKEKPYQSLSESNTQINAIIVVIIIVFLILSIIGIFVAIIIATKDQKKEKRQPKSAVQINKPFRLNNNKDKGEKHLDISLSDTRYQTQRHVQGSGSFIYSGQKPDKPIPNIPDTYAAAFMDNKASESEIFKQRPVDLMVKSKTSAHDKAFIPTTDQKSPQNADHKTQSPKMPNKMSPKTSPKMPTKISPIKSPKNEVPKSPAELRAKNHK